ncbi:PREDICTED: B3 domain-containing protein REM8-like [Brassica oleracea var. oleracea]|uniref:B3 domain-containing protein REM8-like n=1 Tax=Brassica oleracea var. oleracea TaxID=109376 RepID=UPI0006A7356E|nr:PREDICTED: B3 domain-containing protein REM8-like [Brassica oleracea var. oleracea]
MEKASLLTPANPHFFQPLLTGFQSHLNIPVTFFCKHIEGKHEGRTVKLRSDSSDRTWIVKIEGHRLTQGWKEFAKAHDLRVGDVVIFRHEGDMLFHVTAFGTSFCEIQYAPSSIHVKVKEESEEIGESSRREKESSSKPTCFSQYVTASNLSRGAVGVPLDFARRNGLNKGKRVIALRNQEGKTWESKLKSTRSGQVFICRNWRSFCTASKLKIGDSFPFKLLENTETPVFQLCSLSKVKPKKETLSETEEDNVVDKTETPRFVKITTTASSLEIGKQNIPVHFTRANKLNKPGKIVLVDKDKVEWSMKLNQDSRSGTMYIMGGTAWKSFCAANEVVVGESLTLELIRRGGILLLKFCSKMEQPPFKTKARKHKRARVQRLTRESRSKDDVSNQEAKVKTECLSYYN